MTCRVNSDSRAWLVDRNTIRGYLLTGMYGELVVIHVHDLLVILPLNGPSRIFLHQKVKVIGDEITDYQPCLPSNNEHMFICYHAQSTVQTVDSLRFSLERRVYLCIPVRLQEIDRSCSGSLRPIINTCLRNVREKPSQVGISKRLADGGANA